MKAGIAHTVPLSAPAIKLLKTLHEHPISEYVFPRTEQKPLSDMAMLMLLRRMKLTDITVHGFRSSFRDWCGDATTFPREVAEAGRQDQAGAAGYRQGDDRGLL